MATHPYSSMFPIRYLYLTERKIINLSKISDFRASIIEREKYRLSNIKKDSSIHSFFIYSLKKVSL